MHSNLGLRARLHEIIFESETPAGRNFDIALILVILLSVATVMLESIPSIQNLWGTQLYFLEWFFTVVFLIEYGLRLYSVKKPLSYALSFYGIIDLISCLPTILGLIFPGAQSLLVIRAFRLLRVFRIFKLGNYFNEGQVIVSALKASRAKITVFMFSVLIIVMSSGTLMYLIEGPENGYVSIPTSIYWAIVTLTTVGYGDIAPKTALGQLFSSCLMILGYAILAVPTGIVTAEMTRHSLNPKGLNNIACPACSAEGHDRDAKHCKFCGEKL